MNYGERLAEGNDFIKECAAVCCLFIVPRNVQRDQPDGLTKQDSSIIECRLRG
jgi:hypothetical protein